MRFKGYLRSRSNTTLQKKGIIANHALVRFPQLVCAAVAQQSFQILALVFDHVSPSAFPARNFVCGKILRQRPIQNEILNTC